MRNVRRLTLSGVSVEQLMTLASPVLRRNELRES